MAIVVLSVLVALTVFGLAAARAHVYDVRNVSNLRQTMSDYFMWSADHRGRMVNEGLPSDPQSATYRPGLPPLSQSAKYRGQIIAWPQTLYRWRGTSSPVWHSTEGPDTMGGQITPDTSSRFAAWSLPSRFRYSLTMLTAPDIWSADAPPQMTHEEFVRRLAYVQYSVIAFPSAKGVHLHEGSYHDAPRTHASFADGSAARVELAGLRQAAFLPLTPGLSLGKPVLHTAEGYLGRDR